MAKRSKVPGTIQAEVLLQSRRRCCVCFGLKRDEEVKNGQIAHLDNLRNNNVFDNLAFLCLDHHDEYDSSTSQSKGLTLIEVKRYRDELYSHFDDWKVLPSRETLLNFLSFGIDIDVMTDAAIRVGSSIVFYGEKHAFEVLITDEVDYSDADLYVPHLMALDRFASWGWLTFEWEDKDDDEGSGRVLITVDREPVCDEVAKQIKKRILGRGEDVEHLERIAKYHGWKEPT